MVWLGYYFRARKRIGQEEDGRHHTYSQALTFTVTLRSWKIPFLSAGYFI